ncbi:CAP-Gly domain protein [Dictyocaulus viviparus]|uniref:CAP-Gly domain protein n=1 Tax=Dictyocaulus viviparus TaxID=29172 RepID=A0A0D8YAZ0_DICVI|nr:CAP-Gly domain protein [Dictyocaulus viviparus]
MRLIETNNPTAVVTMQDVGSFVSVSGVGKGILHYVGEVHGKNGLYCGIELDTPTGKHNGTYQGVVYFVCRPRHGIFAPLYRVELDEIDDVPMMTASQTTKVHEYSNLSWGDSSDAMVCSNATFVIPPGRSHFEDSEECDLMSIPAPKSILNINREQFKHSEESILGTSVVLDESRVGVENLPVTPLVEAPQWQPSLGSFAQPPSIIETTASPITESRVLSDHTPKECALFLVL